MADDKIHVHIDSSEQHSDIPEIGPLTCPTCNVEAEGGYGMAGGGMGVYMYCPKCYAILSKMQDQD